MKLENRILNTFLEISKQSILLVDEWRKGSKKILAKINVNGQADIVTKLDYQIEKNAEKILNKRFPTFNFIGEEGFNSNYKLFNHDYIAMDPIDGTRSFVEGSKDWSISLCAVIGNLPCVALLNIPDKSLLVTAIKGQGLKLNGKTTCFNKTTSTYKISVSPRQTVNVNKTLVNSKYKPTPISALTPKIGAIINNEIDCAIYYPETGKSASIWDYAAANFLITEGGGTMKSFNGRDLPYQGTGVIHKKGWIAAKNEKIFNHIKNCVNHKL